MNKTDISSSELTSLFAGFVQCGVLTLAYSSKIAANDTWIAVFTALVISLGLLMLYLSVAQKFPKMNLIQINDIIYGRYIGKIISILYLMFFLSTIAANLWLIGSFWTTYLMPETPRPAFIIMFIFISVWAVRKGIEVIARSSAILSIITVVIVVFSFILLLKDMNLRNLLPVMDIPVINFVHAVHILVAIPFCEFVVFSMIIPHTNQSQQIKKAALKGVFIGGAVLLTVTIRDTNVLGLLESYSNSTNFISIRQINIGNILTRLDILVAIGLMLTVFVKITVFLYSTAFGIAQLLHLRSYVPIVIPIGIISAVFGLIIFTSDMEQIYYGMNIWPIYTIPFEVLLPILSLIVTKIRGLPEKEEKIE